MLAVSQITNKELAGILNMTPEGVKAKAIREGWPLSYVKGKGRGGKQLAFTQSTLPQQIQTKIIEVKRSQEYEAKYSELADWQKKRVDEKFEVISLFQAFAKKPQRVLWPKKRLLEKFCKLFQSGEIAPKLVERRPNLSPRTLHRWLCQEQRYRESGKLADIVPQYGKRKGRGKIGAEIGLRIKSQLRPTRRPHAAMYDEYVHNMKKEGREVVSYATYHRYLKAIPPVEYARLTMPADSFEEKCMPYLERDPDKLERNEIWQTDGHVCNFYVVDESGKLFRPTVVVYMDVKTRLPVGFDMAPTESTGLVAGALSNSIENYGLPKYIYMDNGKAYKNKQTLGVFQNEREAIEGMYKRFGCEPFLARDYNAKEKGYIESFWNMVDSRYSKSFDYTYTGRNALERPRGLDKKLKNKDKRIYSFQQAYERFGAFLNWYRECHKHRGRGMNGMTPQQKWDSCSSPIRILDKRELYLASLYRYPLQVKKNGLTWNGMTFRDDDMKLIAHHLGQKVILGIDRHDLTLAYAFDIDSNALLYELHRVELAAMSIRKEDTLEQIKQLKKDKAALRRHLKSADELKHKLRNEETAVYFDDYRDVTPVEPIGLTPLEKEERDKRKEDDDELLGLYE